MLKQSHFVENSPALAGGLRVMLLFVGLGAVSWLTMARIVRGQVFVAADPRVCRGQPRAGREAARGFSSRHIIPNIFGVVITYLALTMPAIILYESFLSYLGLGVQPPMASWGTLIAEGVADQSHPHLLVADRFSRRRAGDDVARAEFSRRRPARRVGRERQMKKAELMMNECSVLHVSSFFSLISLNPPPQKRRTMFRRRLVPQRPIGVEILFQLPQFADPCRASPFASDFFPAATACCHNMNCMTAAAIRAARSSSIARMYS